MVKILFKDWKRLGFLLMETGLNITRDLIKENQYWLLRSVIDGVELTVDKKIELVQVAYENLINMCKKVNIMPTCWDTKYWIIKEKDLGTVIQKDKTDRIRYIAEKMDCDNFASLFSNIVETIYGCNSIGLAIGAVLDKNSRQVIGYHAFNVIPTMDKEPKLYCFEPQDDTLRLIENREVDMGWAIYRINWVLFK